MTLTVGQLRKAIADLPDNMPVGIQAECGWSELNLYITKANLKHYPDYPILTHRLSEGHVDTSRPVYRNHTNTTALLFSEWGNDDAIDITPDTRRVVDGELAPLEITAAEEEA